MPVLCWYQSDSLSVCDAVPGFYLKSSGAPDQTENTFYRIDCKSMRAANISIGLLLMAAGSTCSVISPLLPLI